MNKGGGGDDNILLFGRMSESIIPEVQRFLEVHYFVASSNLNIYIHTEIYLPFFTILLFHNIIL